MGSNQRRRHALLAPDLGPYGPPYLPVVGELYLVRTLLYSSADPAPARRAIVVGVPSALTPTARVRLVTRTSDMTVPGFRHDRDMTVGCNLDGVFSDPVSCLASSWRPGDVKLLGLLTHGMVDSLLEWLS
jgi:hypothetical protein